MRAVGVSLAAVAAGLVSIASAQTFRRLEGCPTLGCVFPPDQQDFLAGQYFDIRLEVHAPVNGSEYVEGSSTTPDENFTFTVGKVGEEPIPASQFFGLDEPEVENWDSSWYEDLFALDAGTPSVFNVAAKAYRRVALYEPGEYKACLTYNDGSTTEAYWTVKDIDEVRKTKNVLLFIGDGMTTNMITAARLIAHKQINGRYQSTMAMDKFPFVGHQMTHSLGSFITDSANSATALFSGHKSSVNALGVYGDSSPDPFDDPKVESIAEIFHRIWGGHIGIVSTAYIADATPGALTAHTRLRGEYPAVVDSLLRGTVNYTWTEWDGPDVLLGGGAEQFCPPEDGGETYMNLNYYNEFADAGYSVVNNNTALQDASDEERLLGIFSTGTMPVWLDRNVYMDNLLDQENSPDCRGSDSMDLPGLKDMTLKAIDILNNRGSEEGWFIMSEAASVDKQMHALDYDRALGDLLELDDTVKASIEKLEQLGALEDTLIVVTADHGHGFDVWGNVDTKYLNAQSDDRTKRRAVGIYERSGESQYVDTGSLVFGDSNFPSNWDPRYTLAQGFGANPDHRESYQVHKNGSRTPAVEIPEDSEDYYVNPEDNEQGFVVNGTLATDASQGVHSLTDVAVFAKGPCEEIFGGVYNNIDVFYKMAECLGLSRPNGPTSGDDTKGSNGKGGHYKGKGNWDKQRGGSKGYHHYDEQAPRYGGKSGRGGH